MGGELFKSVPVKERRTGLVSVYSWASGLKTDPAESKRFGFNGFCQRDKKYTIDTFIQT